MAPMPLSSRRFASCFASLLLMTSPFAVSAADHATLNPAAAPPPVTARRPKIVGLHGDKIEDPYFWLRDQKSPAVLAHLRRRMLTPPP